MGKRWNSEWIYFKAEKENETLIQFRPYYSMKWFEDEGYYVEQLKPRRYNLDEVKWTVKKVLVDVDQPLSTTNLWQRCLNHEILLSRETFLKKMNQLNMECEWLVQDSVGNGKTWSIKEPQLSIFNDSVGDYKWNDNWDTIINVRTNKKYPLRNSGAVKLVVYELNHKDNEIKRLKDHINQLEMDYAKVWDGLKDRIIELQEKVILLEKD